MNNLIIPSEVAELANKLNKDKQEEVQQVLNDIFSGTTDWDKQIEEIQIQGPDDAVSIKLAEVARLNVKRARLTAEKVFDQKREEVQFKMIDYKTQDVLWLKAKQITQTLFKAIEEKAEFKSKYKERFEAEQKVIRSNERLQRILPLTDVNYKTECESLSDESFELFIQGLEQAKKNKEQKEAEEKERKRIEEEQKVLKAKAEAEERERIKAENEMLQKEQAILKAKRIEEQKAFEAQLLKERQERFEAEEAARKEAEEKFRIEKEKAEALRKAEKEAQEKIFKEQEAARLKAEKEKAEAEEELRIQKEAIRKKRESEERIAKLKEEEERKAAKAPIKKQLTIWVDSFSLGKPISENDTTIEIEKKFEQFRSWAKSQIEKI